MHLEPTIEANYVCKTPENFNVLNRNTQGYINSNASLSDTKIVDGANLCDVSLSDMSSLNNISSISNCDSNDTINLTNLSIYHTPRKRIINCNINYDTVEPFLTYTSSEVNDLILGTPSIVGNFDTPMPFEISTPNVFDSDTKTNALSHENMFDSSFSDLSTTICDIEGSKNNDSVNENPFNTLKKIRNSNVNRLIIGQLNINSIRNKFEALKAIVSDNIDILVITETKLDSSFPAGQFCIPGFSPPFRLDAQLGGGEEFSFILGRISLAKN